MEHFIFDIIRDSNTTSVKTNYDLLSEEYFEQNKTIELLYKSYLVEFQNNKKTLIPKQKRICIFCGKSFPEVKFNKIAHRVPELLGNKFLLSDFECDSCNYKFGIYENDLANFLGPTRALSGIKGKSGIPKYKSRDKKLSLSVSTESELEININDDPENHIIIENDMIVFHSKSEPFTPINIYKYLLKSSISFIEPVELQYLQKAIRFLTDDNFEIDMKSLLSGYKSKIVS